jgi:hypothetical protein
MWLFTTKGFVSIVEDKDDSNKLHVRSRVEDDIKSFISVMKDLHFKDYDYMKTDFGDYLFRFSASREEVTNAVAEFAKKIDYRNFKNAVEDKDRHSHYMGVWSEMYRLQKERDR